MSLYAVGNIKLNQTSKRYIQNKRHVSYQDKQRPTKEMPEDSWEYWQK